MLAANKGVWLGLGLVLLLTNIMLFMYTYTRDPGSIPVNDVIYEVEEVVKRDIQYDDRWKEPPCIGKCGNGCTCGILLLMAFHGKVPDAYKNFGGKQHIKLLPKILKTLNISNPKIEVALVHDDYELVKQFEASVDKTIFLNTTLNTKPWQEKIPALMLTPYDYTLYLDTDMVVCEDVSRFFEYLTMFDFAMPQSRSDTESLEKWLDTDGYYSHMRTKLFFGKSHYAEIHYVSAVVFYRKGPDSFRVMMKAKERTTPGRGTYMPDQPALNMALFEEKRASVLRLPSHVMMTNRDFELPTWFENRVHIIHGAQDSLTCEKVKGIVTPGLYQYALGNLVEFRVKKGANRVKPWSNIEILCSGNRFRTIDDSMWGKDNFTSCG